jgi:hypothetical protein
MKDVKIVGPMLVAVALCLATTATAQQPSSPPPTAEAAPPAAAAAPGAEPIMEPRALELLKATSSRLAAARSLSFTAVVSYESPSRPGPPLVYTTRSAVALQRPDKLRVITPGDGPRSEFYYDGKTAMAFSPSQNVVAVAQAPPTIDATLEAAYHHAAIYFPFMDLMVSDPYQHIAEGLEMAFYVGQSQVIGGTTTDMVVYASHGTFVQLWIGADDRLPRRARAMYRRDPLQLRHQVDFSDWKLGTAIPAAAFASARAAAARRIPFAHPDAGPRPGEAPPAVEPPKPQ